MGIDDRDGYRETKAQDALKDSLYDPKQFRGGARNRTFGDAPAKRAGANASRRTRGANWTAAIWLLLLVGFALLFVVLPRYARSLNPDPTVGAVSVEPPPAALQRCDPASLPASGAVQFAEPASLRRSATPLSGLEIVNQHDYPVVAYLTDPGTGRRIVGLSVRPGRTAQTALPAGRYGMVVLAGSSWCNEAVGFRDGARVSLQGDIEIPPGGSSVLALNSTGTARPAGFHVSAIRRLPPPAAPAAPQRATQGPGFVELAQRADGHFYAAGYVNGNPVVFMVDTGATLTTLSSETARKAGLDACESRTFNTANGPAEGCIGRVSTLLIGGLELRDLPVAVMPNLPIDALLGMNVMQRFRLEQQGGVMRLSAR